MTVARIKILVADAQRLFAQTLSIALAQAPDFDVWPFLTEEPEITGLEAATEVARIRPHVAVLDYALPEMDGPAATRALAGWAPNTRVLLLSWPFSQKEVTEGLAAGAAAVLPKSAMIAEVADAIRRAHAGDSPVYSDQPTESVPSRRSNGTEDERLQRLTTLTPREVEVLNHLSYGRPMKETAEELSITPGTLRIHVQNIMEKTGARSKIEAIALARAGGLIKG